MAMDLRRDLLAALAALVAEDDASGHDLPPDGRTAVRLGLRRQAQAIVRADRDILPEIVRIALSLYQVGHGPGIDPMELGQTARRFWLAEAAITYAIVHGAGR
jgi:hypothetical protein